MDSRLFKSWELFKENADGTMEFRQVNNFLNKNPKNGFELRPNGEFLHKKVSSNGRVITTKGRFELKDNFIYVYFDDPYQDFIIRIISCQDKALKVRK
jgi:hypothetical protein